VEVLRHLADGNRNRDIAAKLFISEETLKVHMKHIMDKLGAPFLFEQAPKYVHVVPCNSSADAENHKAFSVNHAVDSAAHYRYARFFIFSDPRPALVTPHCPPVFEPPTSSIQKQNLQLN
jgi:Bacterial regulatory proteins, luxR family